MAHVLIILLSTIEILHITCVCYRFLKAICKPRHWNWNLNFTTNAISSIRPMDTKPSRLEI